MCLEVFDILLPSGVDVFMTNFVDPVTRDNENGRRMMFVEMPHAHSGDVWGPLGMLWSDPGCSWINVFDFQKS